MKKLWKENRSFIVFITLMFCFRSAIADWNEVPTGSMKPTIIEGDRLGVNKMAYDLRIPFTHISLYKIGDPVTGDIIIFDSKVADTRLVKRVIGMPGDTIALHNNRLIVNGHPVQYSVENTNDWLEHLPGKSHQIRVQLPAANYANFDSVVVPENHYLVLGDNRDNSADSRVIGFVPRHEIVGRTRHVIMSLDYENFYLPRGQRFFHDLR